MPVTWVISMNIFTNLHITHFPSNGDAMAASGWFASPELLSDPPVTSSGTWSPCRPHRPFISIKSRCCWESWLFERKRKKTKEEVNQAFQYKWLSSLCQPEPCDSFRQIARNGRHFLEFLNYSPKDFLLLSLPDFLFRWRSQDSGHRYHP
jgi:hypothetical protein